MQTKSKGRKFIGCLLLLVVILASCGNEATVSPTPGPGSGCIGETCVRELRVIRPVNSEGYPGDLVGIALYVTRADGTVGDDLSFDRDTALEIYHETGGTPIVVARFPDCALQDLEDPVMVCRYVVFETDVEEALPDVVRIRVVPQGFEARVPVRWDDTTDYWKLFLAIFIIVVGLFSAVRYFKMGEVAKAGFPIAMVGMGILSGVGSLSDAAKHSFPSWSIVFGYLIIIVVLLGLGWGMVGLLASVLKGNKEEWCGD